MNLEVNGVKARALLDTGAMISVVSRQYLSETPPASSWQLRSVTRDAKPLYGPVKLDLLIGGHPFNVMAFQADVDEDLILGHNFTYPHDLRYIPGERRISVHRGSDGVSLPTPVTMPYQLRESPGLSAYVIYTPLRATEEFRMEPNEVRSLNGSSLRLSRSAYATVASVASLPVVLGPKPNRPVGAPTAPGADCPPGKRASLDFRREGGQSCLADRNDSLSGDSSVTTGVEGEEPPAQQRDASRAAVSLAVRWAAGQRRVPPTPGRYATPVGPRSLPASASLLPQHSSSASVCTAARQYITSERHLEETGGKRPRLAQKYSSFSLTGEQTPSVPVRQIIPGGARCAPVSAGSALRRTGRRGLSPQSCQNAPGSTGYPDAPWASEGPRDDPVTVYCRNTVCVWP
ncbi:hypothetical protein EPUL_005785 [Olea europaea subsp. europaea]|uniref:Peptidase A2 domain-containing protein n=1 Tax=Olea europaea subsp. europaea TaxID=158383 RepID=A0A8S0VIW0_OLEEU|nr:hypothetical protein EPUL_005785 [Olea europaea subsp. europaea]